MFYKETGATTADISDADGTSQFTMDAPFAGKINLAACYVRWSEATGSQTTTQGVLSIEVGGTEVATLTASQSGAIGDTQSFTKSSETGNPWLEFSSGDVIEVKVKTQAVGGTITGDGQVHLYCEFALGA